MIRIGRQRRYLSAMLITVLTGAGAVAATVGGVTNARAATTPTLTFTAPAGITSAVLSGMSCPTTTFCAAVDTNGDVLTTSNPAAGATAWSTPVQVDTTGLSGISCPSPAMCVVADNIGRVLTSTNPTGGAAAWTSTATLSGNSFAFGPSCPSVSFCVVVAQGSGVLTSSNPTSGAAAWTFTALGDTSTNSVACASAALCLVGDQQGNILTSSNPTGGSGSWVSSNITSHPLYGISCPSASLCAAVDYQGGNVLASTHPATGSPSFWSAANIDTGHGLTGVACASTSPAFCAAVDDGGNVLTSSDPTAGAGAWAVQNIDTNILTGIACATSNLCIAFDSHGEIVVGTDPVSGPSITGIAPGQGPTAGGTQVSLSGSGFSTSTGGTTVDFGTAASSSVSCSTSTSCTATSPPGSPGGVNITATVSGITSAAGPANSFTYVSPQPPPAVTAMSPQQGPAGGGTAVTITGSGFDPTPGATQFIFGRVAASSVTCSSTTSCVATSPPGLGPQVVIAIVAGQTSSGSAASIFRQPPPQITGILPSNGSTAGGTQVTITGANLDPAPGTTHVSFGGTPAHSVACSSSTTCVATSPPGTGAVFVTVTEATFTTPVSSAVSFTYDSPPVGPVSCGATITQSVTLTQDLGPCPGNGLVIVGSRITVDLAGHRVFGIAGAGDNRVGIELAGATRVTVTSSTPSNQLGDVDGFASGVSIDGGSGNTVSNLNVHDNIGPLNTGANRGDGIVIGSVTPSSSNVINNDVVAHNGVFDGVGVFSPQSVGNTIVNTSILDNNIGAPMQNGTTAMIDDGINLGSGLTGSNATTIKGDTINHNAYNGIDACSNAGGAQCLTANNVITNNHIEANGTQGVSPGLIGNGINIWLLQYASPAFPPSHDEIDNNVVINNAGIGILVVNPNTTVRDNVVLGNSTDPQFDLGAPYDLYDETFPKDCFHNTYWGNTYDAGEASPSCTTAGGTAVSPTAGAGTSNATQQQPSTRFSVPAYTRGT